MEINEETIQTQIPYYLTQESKDNLVKALNNFPNVNYYIDFLDGILQGDGWSGFEVLRFEDGERKEIKGIVLSNSCDISPDNIRDIPSKITFAPIISLNKLIDIFEKSGKPKERINNRIKSIIEQKTTNMIFLPKGGSLEEDYVALLDDLHTMPLKTFEEKKSRLKQFRLSQIGFYLFILKISVHLCRFHENIERN